MQIGEVYKVSLDSTTPDTKGTKNPVKGEVVYVHPRRRYATLEFQGVHGRFRESFFPEQLTDKNRLPGKGKYL